MCDPKCMVFELFMSQNIKQLHLNHWTEIGYVFHSGLALSILFRRKQLFRIIKHWQIVVLHKCLCRCSLFLVSRQSYIRVAH